MLEGCAELLVVAEAGDGAEAIELAERHHPDVAVVDIGMKKMNGIETTARLLRRSPETAVLILTVYNDERYIASAAAAAPSSSISTRRGEPLELGLASVAPAVCASRRSACPTLNQETSNPRARHSPRILSRRRRAARRLAANSISLGCRTAGRPR